MTIASIIHTVTKENKEVLFLSVLEALDNSPLPKPETLELTDKQK